MVNNSTPNSFPPEAPETCERCPRLATFLKSKRQTHPDYFNRPVPSFGPKGGDASVRLLIVGLAPGMHGANRTGRPFTGDYAGDLLYSTLATFGFSNDKYGAEADDGLALNECMITNAIRCLPPENKPTGAEANECRPFLVSRVAALPHLTAIVCLGKVSHDNTLKALGLKLSAHPFGHGTEYTVDGPNGAIALLSSYHCSRYNTNTGRLTEQMFHDVFEVAKSRIAAAR